MQFVNTNQARYSHIDFIRSSHSHKCPLCGGTDGSCSHSTDGSMALCLHTHSSVPGFKYIGDTNGGAFWGMFVPSDESSSERDGRWAELKIEREQRRKEAAIVSAKGKLDPEEIDTNARKLVKYFGLSRSHQANLLARGFTDEQINTLGFFSVAPGEKLPPLFPANYPGVKGGSLAVAGSAIFMPAFNLEAKIHGGQYRLDNGESGRYRWPCGYKSSHLKNGELPLTFVPGLKILSENPTDWSDTDFGSEAYFCEGFPKATKAALTYNRLFCGAAGGNFSSSSEQVINLIETKKITTINLTPDAGDVKNPQVMRRWIKQYEFFRDLGLFVRVVWWGQIDKEYHNDIDELPIGATFSFISWEEFLRYARGNGGLPKEENWFDVNPVSFMSYPERVLAKQKELEDFLPWTSEISDTTFVELNLDNLPKGIYDIKSGTGTGKSTIAQKIIRHFSEGNLLSYRNSFLEQTCEKSEGLVVHINDITTDDKEHDKQLRKSLSWLAACVDSCFKLGNRKVLILEEADKLLQHMLKGATCSKNRRIILEAFMRLVRSADYVFCFDADFSSISARYLSEISGGKPTFGIWNKGQMSPWKVSMYSGEFEVLRNGEKRERTNARGGFEKTLITDIILRKKVIVFADSQRQLIGIERVLERFNVKVLRVDSYTKADPLTRDAVNEFLRTPDRYIQEEQIQVLLISPTAESNLDITLPHFDKVYGMFFGVINHRQNMQMLARYRQPVERVVWCRTFSLIENNGSRSVIPEYIARNYLRHHQETCNMLAIHNYIPADNSDNMINNLDDLLNPKSDKWQSPHFKALCGFTALDNYSKANLRELMISDLTKIGHNVEMLPMYTKSPYTHVKSEIDGFLLEESESINESEDIPYEEAVKLWESMSLTPSDRHKCIKAKLKHRLPDFELTEEFIYENFLKDQQYISRLELRWAMLNFESQRLHDTDRWVKSLTYGDEIWDMRSRALKAKVLIDLGVPELINKLKNEVTWSCESESIVQFKEVCIRNAHKLLCAFGMKAHHTSDASKLVNSIFEKIGIDLDRRRSRVGNGKRKYFYNFNISTFSDNNDTIRGVLEAIDRRFRSLPELSPTSHKYKKIYTSGRLGTVVVPDIDPLEKPHLFNQFMGVEQAADCLEDLEIIKLLKDEQQTTEFELGVVETLAVCDSWEMVADFLGTYSRVERQIGWALLPVASRARLAGLRLKN